VSVLPPDPGVSGYELTLFVSGASDRSARAIASITELCDRHLPGRAQLSVVDVREDPAVASSHGVMAAPTLVKHRPPPVRSLVGDLSDFERVLRMLGLPAAPQRPR
jgi:circadian clock protein KaiB